MENPIDQFFKSIRELRLTDEGAARIRERLVAHIRSHPLLATSPRSPYQDFIGLISPFTSFVRRPIVVLALSMLIMVGGATTYAAAGALPGSALYMMKVNVLEPVRGFLALSPEAKAAWKISLIETRLEEVGQLMEKEKSTPEDAKDKAKFDRSVNALHTAIQKLSKDDPDATSEVESSFSALLDEHKKTPKTLGNATTSSDALKTGPVNNSVKDTTETKAPDEIKSPNGTTTKTRPTTPPENERKNERKPDL